MLRGGAAGPCDIARAALRRLGAVRAWAVTVVGAVAVTGAVTVVAGCAVHNPTDQAQRTPVIPTKLPTALADGTPTFNRRAASRIVAQLGYGDTRPKGRPPGPLRAFVASCRGVTAPCLNIFFFYRGRYVGAAFAEPQAALSVRQQDGHLVRATVPALGGGFQHVQYIWTGAEVLGLTSTGSVSVVRTPSHTLS